MLACPDAATNLAPYGTKSVVFVTALDTPHDAPVAVLANQHSLGFLPDAKAMSTTVVVDEFTVTDWAKTPKIGDVSARPGPAPFRTEQHVFHIRVVGRTGRWRGRG